jgi:hypothetical protein
MTGSVSIARIKCTLGDIIANNTVARKTWLTETKEGTGCVFTKATTNALNHSSAIVKSATAFVRVVTIDAGTVVAKKAAARKGTISVDAHRTVDQFHFTGMKIKCALVDVGAIKPVAVITRGASARKRTFSVNANGFSNWAIV